MRAARGTLVHMAAVPLAALLLANANTPNEVTWAPFFISQRQPSAAVARTPSPSHHLAHVGQQLLRVVHDAIFYRV